MKYRIIKEVGRFYLQKEIIKRDFKCWNTIQSFYSEELAREYLSEIKAGVRNNNGEIVIHQEEF